MSKTSGSGAGVALKTRATFSESALSEILVHFKCVCALDFLSCLILTSSFDLAPGRSYFLGDQGVVFLGAKKMCARV